MKHLSIFVLFLSIVFSGYSQDYPIAVNDTADIRLGEYLTINVTANDYNPSGLPFKIVQIGGQFQFTDSTITFYFGYEENYNLHGYKSFSYKIEDENGVFNLESYGRVTLNVINNFYDSLDINNVKAPIFPSSGQFWTSSLPSGFFDNPPPNTYEYPKGSRKHTIYTTNFWVGGMDQDGQLRLAGERYRQDGIDFWPGPICSYNGVLSIDTASVYQWNRVWKLSKSDIEFHVHNYNKPGYEPIPNIASWPAHGNQSLHQSQYLAPFIDVDGDGIYNPYSGDYPLIRGDQCVFFVINDLRQHTETEGNTIGIEIHGMFYQFNQPENLAINSTTFLHYKIFNRSSYTISDTYVGIWTDFDLGNFTDDYVGCDVDRGMYFGYNGDEIDGYGEPWSYGENPPAQGVVILGGPSMDANELDDPGGGCDESINGVGFGDDVIDNERYGMTSFLYHYNSVSPQGDPNVPQDYYNYMQAKWQDGQQMNYGGFGRPEGGSYGPDCRYLFPGLTDPCFWGTDGLEPNGPVDWSEENAWNGEPKPPGDRRGLGSMGPFTFLPNSVQTIDVAYVTARGDNGRLSSVELLKVYVDSIRAKYIQNIDDFGTQYLGVDETLNQPEQLKFFPNPVENLLQVEYNHKSQQAVYAIYDLYGRLLISENMNTSGQFIINVSELKSGLYIISVLDDHFQTTGRFVKR
ncbi:MAG: T9SS type A sorting domain-containing protein [Bacteroidales bacterium]|nr:T9SS type A sorting domain-containing protein [Bacteroidales bacterium]